MVQNNSSECLDENILLIFHLMRLLNLFEIKLIFLIHLKHSNCLTYYFIRNAYLKYK
jgi:hypothetical protein